MRNIFDSQLSMRAREGNLNDYMVVYNIKIAGIKYMIEANLQWLLTC